MIDLTPCLRFSYSYLRTFLYLLALLWWVAGCSKTQPAGDTPSESLPEGTYISFASTDSRYDKDSIPVISPQTHWETRAWKGEIVNTQVLLWTKQPLEQVTLHWSELKDGKGNSIPAESIEARFIRYVMADGESVKGGCNITPKQDSVLVADLIDTVKHLRVAAGETQPIWLSIDVAEKVPAGTFRGEIEIKEGGQRKVGTLSYAIEVIDRTLPDPQDWKFHLDLWQNPDAIARVHKVEKWSDEHIKVMKPYMQMLAEAGQKVITATLIHDPWNSQTYDIYGPMIRWTKKKDGSWNYDYTIFDQWVTFMMALGIDNLIECYSMIPWNLKFYYYDEALGKQTYITAQPGSPEYKAHWQPMLDDFARHLKKKGWFEKTTIAMDERPMEAMQKAIAIIKAADKDFKISLAGNYHPTIQKDLFDYCVASNQRIGEETLQARKEAGLITTFYTCCVEAFPNTFTISPPAESAWLAWHAASKGYDGYLRWAYNSWPEQPLQDSRFGHWPSGDTFLVYPGAKSSVRFERLIEGIEDYEKIRILKETFEKAGQHEKLEELQKTVGSFELDALNTTSAAQMLEPAQKLLNSI